MSSGIVVYWKSDRRPTQDEIAVVLEDYVRGLATEITLDRTMFFVTLPGVYSFPFARMGPASTSKREYSKELTTEPDGVTPRPRWFEVFVCAEYTEVITRQADEITSNIAHGFAVLLARAWDGKIESG